ncbi:MAG TPA: hypothetical protein VER32_11580 [Pyrinomonadaceae bacterium]|nr:hypothetical protein [Pyrinomonadaceae bacterium]
MSESQGDTGTRDVVYNLVSIVYHSLQGAETIDMYIRDAQQSGDHDLAQFFSEVKQENTRRAQRAKELLPRYLGEGGGRQAASGS